MAIPFMAYNMAIGKTPTGGDHYESPEPERKRNVHPLEPTPYASGGFWPTSDYYSEMYSEEEDYEPVYDHSMEIETMRANERMGAALAHLYTLYPEAKAQVKEFLDDYPFTF